MSKAGIIIYDALLISNVKFNALPPLLARFLAFFIFTVFFFTRNMEERDLLRLTVTNLN